MSKHVESKTRVLVERVFGNQAQRVRYHAVAVAVAVAVLLQWESEG